MTKIDKNPLPSIARLATRVRARFGQRAAPNPTPVQSRVGGRERCPRRLLPRVEGDIADGAQYERHNTRDYDRSHLSALHVPTAAAKHPAAKNLSVSRRCEIELNQMGDAVLAPSVTVGADKMIE